MVNFGRITASVVLASSIALGTAEAGGLKGSISSMRNQYAVAKKNDFTFLRTPSQVREFAEKGRLDTVAGNADYRINKVSFPYARPEVVAFIERLGRLYREANGEQMVVTSLTRPTALQPRNAHKLSVHPAGMAVDLRVPFKPSARKWLESTLLELETAGVLDVTRERRPPHYHVAVFPGRFAEYAAANPLPPRPPEPVKVEVAEADVQSAAVTAIADTAETADASSGSGAWGIAALTGIVLAGGAGAAARKRIPARRRTDRE
jgi:hypothetical protein